MGTPQFATASLQALLDAKYNVVGVITAPDKPAGRGKKITESDVKKCALKHGLNILQPANLKDLEFVKEFKSLDANLGVVVAFRMLPEVIWSMPELGTFNLHASLLPQYRGAAPINHAIINGETQTGVTTFFLQHKIDTGDIIFSQSTPIGPGENAGELHDRLMQMGANLLLKTVKAIQTGNLESQKQDDLKIAEYMLREAPKIYKEDCLIDWNKPVEHIYNLIRGLSPYPTAYTVLANTGGEKISMKIYKGNYYILDSDTKPGTIETDSKSYLSISGINGKIEILDLQISGKKRMDIRSFLNGFDMLNNWKIIPQEIQ